MKTKIVELYADLHPNWQDSITTYVFATSFPVTEKISGVVRVKITVELPEVYPNHNHDICARGNTLIA